MIITAGQRLMVWLAVWRNSLLSSSTTPCIVSSSSLAMPDPSRSRVQSDDIRLEPANNRVGHTGTYLAFPLTRVLLLHYRLQEYYRLVSLGEVY